MPALLMSEGFIIMNVEETKTLKTRLRLVWYILNNNDFFTSTLEWLAVTVYSQPLTSTRPGRGIGTVSTRESLEVNGHRSSHAKH